MLTCATQLQLQSASVRSPLPHAWPVQQQLQQWGIVPAHREVQGDEMVMMTTSCCHCCL